MQEQERVASEEAEKRLKATLAAKRDPSTNTSRISSPSVAEQVVNVEGESKSPAQENKSSEDVVMENGDALAQSASSQEVRHQNFAPATQEDISCRRVLGCLN